MFAAALALLLSACGTLTGIPAHGGGKRFAVEQELVAASARAAVKNMVCPPCRDAKPPSIFPSWAIRVRAQSAADAIPSALIRGEYTAAPENISDYAYPTVRTSTTTASSCLTGQTDAVSVLNAPASSRSQTRGIGNSRSAGIAVNGLGEYRNETLTANPRDPAFLDNLIQTVFYLRGVEIVPSAYADTDVFVTVDVFGTIRSRTELHLYNAESLKAQTKLEYFAVDRNSRKLLIAPTTSAYESEYRENYALWTDPFKTVKTVKPADGLMIGFAGIRPYGGEIQRPSEKEYGGFERGKNAQEENETPVGNDIPNRRRNAQGNKK